MKEVKILETAEDIQERREQVLRRYLDFKEAARVKREKLEDSRRFQYFRRDADELESWIYEKLQAASDESYKDPTNLQVRGQMNFLYCDRTFHFKSTPRPRSRSIRPSRPRWPRTPTPSSSSTTPAWR